MPFSTYKIKEVPHPGEEGPESRPLFHTNWRTACPFLELNSTNESLEHKLSFEVLRSKNGHAVLELL